MCQVQNRKRRNGETRTIWHGCLNSAAQKINWSTSSYFYLMLQFADRYGRGRFHADTQIEDRETSRIGGIVKRRIVDQLSCHWPNFQANVDNYGAYLVTEECVVSCGQYARHLRP